MMSFPLINGEGRSHFAMGSWLDKGYSPSSCLFDQKSAPARPGLSPTRAGVWNSFAKLDRSGFGKDWNRRNGTDTLRALGELAEDGLVTADQAR